MAVLRCLAFALLGFVAARKPSTGQAPVERNNWVVLVATSRYWYNYRHASNVLSFYHTVKRLGVPDSNIIVMMSEDYACNPRNSLPGTVWAESSHQSNLYGLDVEVDYRGDEVSVENFLRLLTGRHHPGTARNKRLLTDSMSNVFVYITGHSGEEFIKFQDWEEITSNDIADAFKQMHQQERYKNVFWLSDTCQAATLQNQFDSPNIIAIGSSGKKENSYSHHMDPEIGVAVIDRFTYYAFGYLMRETTKSELTIQAFIDKFNSDLLMATPELRADLYWKPANQTRITDFMASIGRMRVLDASALPMTADSSTAKPAVACSRSLAEVGQDDNLSCAAPALAFAGTAGDVPAADMLEQVLSPLRPFVSLKVSAAPRHILAEDASLVSSWALPSDTGVNPQLFMWLAALAGTLCVAGVVL